MSSAEALGPFVNILPADVLSMVKTSVIPPCEGNLGTLNGIVDAGDSNAELNGLKAILAKKVTITPEQENVLRPLFEKHCAQAGMLFSDYFITEDISETDLRTMSPLEFVGYSLMFAKAEAKQIQKNLVEQCLTSYVHELFLPVLSKLLAELHDGDVYSATKSTNKQWPFPMVYTTNNLTVKLPYICRSDIRVDCYLFPIIICEIDSSTGLDENRLQLQAAYLAKLARYCNSSTAICNMAIYFCKTGRVSVYYMTADHEKVYYSEEQFFIDLVPFLFQLMFRLYNFTHYLAENRQVLSSASSRRNLQAVIEKNKTLPSRATVHGTKRSRMSEGSAGGRQSAPAGQSGLHDSPDFDLHGFSIKRLRLGHTELSGDVLWEGSTCTGSPEQVWRDEEDVRDMELLVEKLRKAGIRLLSEKSPLLPPYMAQGQESTSGRAVVVKSTLEWNEISIHSSLCKLMPPSPHIIPLLGYVGPVDQRYLLVTPLRMPLLSLDTRTMAIHVARFMTDLLLGADFLHQNHIAHLDIRPENLVYVDEPKPHMQYIDFGLAVRVKGPNDRLRGFRGYASWVAPEVIAGEYFRPFAADYWACGRVIWEYNEYLSTSPTGQWLVKCSMELRAPDEEERMLAMENIIKELSV